MQSIASEGQSLEFWHRSSSQYMHMLLLLAWVEVQKDKQTAAGGSNNSTTRNGSETAEEGANSSGNDSNSSTSDK